MNSSSQLASINPLTQEVVGSVERTAVDALPGYIERSRRAQKNWLTLSLEQRVNQVQKAYQGLQECEEELSMLISLEMGKDRRRAGYEASGTIHGGNYLAADSASAFKPQTVRGGGELQYRPLGVVAVISPWNYPLAMANNLLVPALIAGNAVILKPSEHTPLVADLLVNVLNEVLPEHLLQIVHGDGTVGDALVKSDVNMVAFTGSLATGQKIMANAASGVKKLVMELGGNDPMIVMDSADIQAAARFAVASSFENAGQMCTSTERIYVDSKIADEFEQAVLDIASRYRVGGWHEANVNIGPLANLQQHEKVTQHIQDAVAKGASLLLGSDTPQPPFIQPTVISKLTPDMLLESEETFGPVVAMASYEDIEQAISRANDSVYGLGAVVFGNSQAKAVADRLEAGMIGVNSGVGGGGDTPWVGAKQSGVGYHGSIEGHRQFAQVTVVNY